MPPDAADKVLLERPRSPFPRPGARETPSAGTAGQAVGIPARVCLPRAPFSLAFTCERREEKGLDCVRIISPLSEVGLRRGLCLYEVKQVGG